MPTNDARVSQIILQYLSNAGWREDSCCGILQQAFRSIQAFRQKPGNSLDVDVAAAEHYLFARSTVCTGFVSSTQMKALVIAYDVKKILDRARGDPNAARVTTNPVSPPDWDVVLWGLAGCDEGSADRDRCNADISPPMWRPVEEILGKSVY